MSKYYINYNTGAGDEVITGTLEEAMKVADKGAAYTQQPIKIEDENGEVIAQRTWYGYDIENDKDLDEQNQNPIVFGSSGFYGDWTEEF